jgi:hypothetical protein
MTTGNNYSHIWKGKNNGGKSKGKVVEIIAAHINTFNLCVPCNGKTSSTRYNIWNGNLKSLPFCQQRDWCRTKGWRGWII